MSQMNKDKAETYKINKYYNLVVYDEYKGKKPVIISVDVSGGLGRDNTAVVVINPENLLPMAFFKFLNLICLPVLELLYLRANPKCGGVRSSFCGLRTSSHRM